MMKRLQNSVLRLLLLLSLLAMQNLAHGQEFGRTAVPQPSAPAMFQSGGVAAIGPGDLLEVTVFETPELSGKARVTDAGDISLPLVGKLHLAGLNTEKAQELVALKLVEKQLLKDPQVSVFIAEYATQGVSVLGEVKKPGIYPTLGQHRLLDYISLAEGLTPFASTSITITPRGESQRYTLSLPSLTSPTPEQNPEIRPGDTIFVSKTGLVYVVGDVGKPGGFALDHDQHLTVLQAIALAQGLNFTAAKSNAKVIRKDANGGREELAVDLSKILSAKAVDMPLQNDDILFVPNSKAKGTLKGMQNAIANAAGAAIYRF